MHQAYFGDLPFYKIKDLNNEILDGTFYAEELQKIYKTDGIFNLLKAFLKSGDERNNRSFWLNGQNIQQPLILGYLQNNFFIMLKLSKPTADHIVKVVIVFAITISLYNLSTNSAVDFSIIDFYQNVSNFTKQCITKHLR